MVIQLPQRSRESDQAVDVSLDRGYVITRHEDNKGGRDEQVPLHQNVVEHLRNIVDFGPLVFPWPKGKRCLYEEFARIQTAAGIDLPCPEKHKHTDACHRYGFHDLRRAFATMNADRLTGDALQALMRHKATQRYISVARQLDQSTADLYVPNVERKKAAV
jgi:integrase